MNENIDLTKILKDCPIGWTFYSSVYGEVEFFGISYDYVSLKELENMRNFPIIQKQRYPIRLMTDSGEEYCISRRGRCRHGVGECTLFPSKEQRDWSKFTAPWYKKEKFDPKTLKVLDKVLVKDIPSHHWNMGIFSHYVEGDEFPYKCVGNKYRLCIPYNEETKHLVGTNDEAPEYYRYWEE